VALIAAVAVLVTLVGCGDSGGDGGAESDPVSAAQARLDEAEADLDEAHAAYADAAAQLCDDSAAYIEAVDRYGGLLTDDAATVGSVTDAGDDLEDPRSTVGASADDVRAARNDVAEAEAELAEAQVELAEATSGTTAPGDGTTPTTTAAPPVPEDALDRAARAEEDLAVAFEDVDESTPLSQATVQVNAAAVSVQVAWMQLFASAGCLDEDQHQEAVAAVADYTRALQSALEAAGYYDAGVDGIYGAATVGAVERLQADAGLPVTGLVDRATAAALDEAVSAAGGDAAAAEVAHTAALQTVLALTGHWTGPIDGEWSEALTNALRSFQTDLGLEPSGVVDPATIAAAQQALEELQNPTTTTPEGGDEVPTTATGP